MTNVRYVKALFSLDTLDTRFTISSKDSTRSTYKPISVDPVKLSGNDLAQSADGVVRTPEGSSPPRWRSAEFIFYAVVIVVALPLMFKSVYDVSNPGHPNFSKFESLLSPGWIPGRKVDNSDQQYAGFRDNIPYLIILLCSHPVLRKAFERIYPISPSADASTPSHGRKNTAFGGNDLGADNRLDRRVSFDLYFAIAYIFALHGSSAFKILLILYINFTIATKINQAYVPLTTWIFNIGILFANELFKGYPYARLASLLHLWLQTAEPSKANVDWGAYLDSYNGLLPRWEILFNITVLRLISFNLDHYWSSSRSASNALEVSLLTSPYIPSFADRIKKKQLDPSALSERDRVDLPAQPKDYSFRNYLAYALYAPLYLTGPILTFNDYISQARYSSQSITTRRTILYGIRFLLCLLTMELMLHFIYAVAISKAQPAWELYTPFQVSMISYFNLHIIWLKLLLPWRFFRLWALIDGIDPPENMVRCMSDNYSTLAFWRAWHRSYNRWIVRYIYIPLGGSGGSRATQGKWGTARSVLNMLTVFTFVALWHDIQLRLLIWGWLITLFVLPEVLAGYLFPKRKWQHRKEAYRVICGVGAVGNILMMMAANLVGFAIGLDGLKGLVQGLVGSYSGLVFLATACGALFVGVQVMFELREQELRQGIKMKC